MIRTVGDEPVYIESMVTGCEDLAVFRPYSEHFALEIVTEFVQWVASVDTGTCFGMSPSRCECEYLVVLRDVFDI